MVAMVTAYARSSRLQLISSDDIDYSWLFNFSRKNFIYLYQLSRAKLPK